MPAEQPSNKAIKISIINRGYYFPYLIFLENNLSITSFIIFMGGVLEALVNGTSNLVVNSLDAIADGILTSINSAFYYAFDPINSIFSRDKSITKGFYDNIENIPPGPLKELGYFTGAVSSFGAYAIAIELSSPAILLYPISIAAITHRKKIKEYTKEKAKKAGTALYKGLSDCCTEINEILREEFPDYYSSPPPPP